MMRVVVVAALAAVVLSMPTNSNLDPSLDIKPSLDGPERMDGNVDDYSELIAGPKESVDQSIYADRVPQAGSLISLEEHAMQIDEAPKDEKELIKVEPAKPTGVEPLPVPDAKREILDEENKDHAKVTSVLNNKPAKKVEEIPLMPDVPNKIGEHYPIQHDEYNAAYKESSQTVAKPETADPTKQNVWGVSSGTVDLQRPEDHHPMEILTPLTEDLPCDKNRQLDVVMPALVYKEGEKIPYLPVSFGCSSEKDVSREKASPEISWSNLNFDVQEFSLQMIDMGDECQYAGPEAGRIHWHVTGMKQHGTNLTLAAGASHDSRMLHGGKELPNQWLEEYYAGPCPTRGTVGCYRIKVLAHRANGWCQCGFQDFKFERADYPQEWVYKDPLKVLDASESNSGFAPKP